MLPGRRRANRLRLDITNALFLIAGARKSTSPLDPGAAGEAAMPLTMSEPVRGGADKGEEPQDGAGEVDPDGVLHALNARVALGVLIDVHLSKNAEQCDPQNEEDEVPCPHCQLLVTCYGS